METLKKYWWIFLLLPIGVYIIYVYYRAKGEVNQTMAKVRQAKADKAMLATEPETETLDGRINTEDQVI